MKFGKVIGSVIATEKDPNLSGIKLLVILPLDKKLKPLRLAPAYIAADAVGQVGLEDIVTVVFSQDAAEAFPKARIPVDASVVGIVDKASAAALKQSDPGSMQGKLGR